MNADNDDKVYKHWNIISARVRIWYWIRTEVWVRIWHLIVVTLLPIIRRKVGSHFADSEQVGSLEKWGYQDNLKPVFFYEKILNIQKQKT